MKRLGQFVALTVGVIATLSALGWAWLEYGATRAVYTDAHRIRTPANQAAPRDVLWEPAEAFPPPLNTDVDEYEPRISADGRTLFFVRGKSGGQADLYTATRTADGWTEPAPIDALNTPGADELGPTPDRSAETIFFYSDRAGGRGGYDLWMSRRGADGWRTPLNLGPAVNTAHNEYGVSLSPDGATIYFASNRPRPDEIDEATPPEQAWPSTLRETRESRDYDLYAAPLTDAGAGDAVRIDALSTPFDEGSPGVSPTGDFLYFASNRPGGAGGFDLYRARIVDGSFRPVERLEGVVNTPANELDPALAMGGFELLFSSDRANPPGDASPGEAGVAPAATPPGDEVRRNAEQAAPTRASLDDADRDYDLLRSLSREVYLEREAVDARIDWSVLLPPLLWLLLLLLLLLTLLGLNRLSQDERFRKLSLLAKCLLASLLIHMLLLAAFTVWQVSAALDGYLREPGGTKVILSAGASADELARQVRAGMTEGVERAAGEPPAPVARVRPESTAEAPARPVETAAPSLARAEPRPIDRSIETREASPTRSDRAAEVIRAPALAAIDTLARVRAPEAPAPEARAEPPLRAQTPPASQRSTRAEARPDATPARPALFETSTDPARARSVDTTIASIDEPSPPNDALPAPSADQPAAAPPASLPEMTMTTPDGALPEATRIADAEPEAALAPPGGAPTAERARAAPAPARETPEPTLLDTPTERIASSTGGGARAPRVLEGLQDARDSRASMRDDSIADASTTHALPALDTIDPGGALPTSAAPRANIEPDVASEPPTPPTAARRTEAALVPQASDAPASFEVSPIDPLELPAPIGLAIRNPATDAPASPARSPESERAPRSSTAAPDALSALGVIDFAVALPDETLSAESAEAAIARVAPAPPETRAVRAPTGSLDAPPMTPLIDQTAPALVRVSPASSASFEGVGDPSDAPPSATDPADAAPSEQDLALDSVAVTPDAMPVPDRLAPVPESRVAWAGESINVRRATPSPSAPGSALEETSAPRAESASAALSPALAAIVRNDAPDDSPAPRPTDRAADASVPMLTALDPDVRTPEEFQPAANLLEHRDREARAQIVERRGGSEQTERAVQDALRWLARVQSPDGRWDGYEFANFCEGCEGTTRIESDVALTGLSLVAFFGAGYSHIEEGPFQDTVARALEWLVARQNERGDLRAGETMYSHGIATMALAEAYAMSGDPELRPTIEKAVRFILDAHDPGRGGWRYEPGMQGDTSVLGWQIMALVSAERAGVPVGELGFEAARRWLDLVSEAHAPGLYAYQPGMVFTPSMTAEGMFVQQLLGLERDHPRMRESASLLVRNLPDWDERPNTYYWYYATLALFQHQGEPWERWNAALVEELIANQRRDGDAAGSWDPIDRWARVGGRVYQTAICALSLEVYYRYLPLYADRFASEDGALDRRNEPRGGPSDAED